MITTLGLDLSLTGTGVIKLKEDGTYTEKLIKSKPTEGAFAELLRLKGIVEKIELDGGIDVAVIEGLSFSTRNSTALVQLSALNYFVRDALYQKGIPFVIVAPTTLKKFVSGKGNTKKDGMMLETYKHFNVSFTNDNLCDSYGLAQIGQKLLAKSKDEPIYRQEVISLLSKQLV